VAVVGEGDRLSSYLRKELTMTHDVQEPADHGLVEAAGVPASAGGARPAFVPMAEAAAGTAESPAEFTPDPEGTTGLPEIPEGLQPGLWPGRFHLCRINLREGCYRITYRPNSSFVNYYGTMRVDNDGGVTTISGDLYRYFRFPFPRPPILTRASQPTPDLPPGIGTEVSKAPVSIFPLAYGIPIYPRNRYHSYLRVTNIRRPPILTTGPCQLTLTAQQYVYTQPPPGSFDGTFPAPPGTRTVTIVLAPKPAPPGFTSSYFEGTLYEAGVPRGTFTMGWVSSFFRRAKLEIDTLVGAVAPQPVGSETFTTIFAKAGWDLSVVYDQKDVPVPAGVVASDCWTSGALHNLMTTIRNPATNLDTEWHMHLLVVPAKITCGRGVMYDSIGVPREGVASFSDDGYPSAQSAWFGTASNKKQRDVPRAFLRSATHEVGHGFNQIHQEQEAGADNSIMTTTPSVADVLGPAPGVFPDDINLAFNEHVRHHLVHFPDITVRPGGMTFGSGHSSAVPEADRYWFSAEELELSLEAAHAQVELGEPLGVSWTLKNTSQEPLPAPTDIGVEAQHAQITVTDPQGRSRLMPSFVIRTDHVAIGDLEPGKGLKASTRLYWSSKGFAFPEPGRYEVALRIVWASGGVPFGVQASTDVFVSYPQTDADNEAAAALLHPEVGMYVALGGGAPHLEEAVSRLEGVAASAEGDQPGAKALRGYEDIMPGAAPEATPAGDLATRARGKARKKPVKTRA